MRMPVEQQLPAATIVEYTDRKQAVNRYPDQIVSPPAPRRCCSTGMEQVGAEHREGEWLFLYMRCRECGYTVRRFRCTDAPSLCVLSELLGPAGGAISERDTHLLS